MSAFSLPLVVLLLMVTSQLGHCLLCYECSSRSGFDNYIGCRYGKAWYLQKVECIGPSVCATYILTTESQGYPTSTVVNRGCQAIRYGSTCEDIFNELRRKGSVFPGHHECSTCSTDYCNLSPKLPVPTLAICIFTLLHLRPHL